MACHFRIASENAKFGQPEVNLGLIPGYGGTQRLTQLIGKGRAIELLISANMIDAPYSSSIWIGKLCSTPRPTTRKSQVNIISSKYKSSHSHRKMYRSCQRSHDQTKNGYEIEMTGFGHCFGTEDMKEGTKHFGEEEGGVWGEIGRKLLAASSWL